MHKPVCFPINLHITFPETCFCLETCLFIHAFEFAYWSNSLHYTWALLLKGLCACHSFKRPNFIAYTHRKYSTNAWRLEGIVVSTYRVVWQSYLNALTTCLKVKKVRVWLPFNSLSYKTVYVKGLNDSNFKVIVAGVSHHVLHLSFRMSISLSYVFFIFCHRIFF